MVIKILSPVDGVYLKIQVKEGAVVIAHDTLTNTNSTALGKKAMRHLMFSAFYR